MDNVSGGTGSDPSKQPHRNSWFDRLFRRHDEFKFALTTIRMFIAFIVVALCSVIIRLVVWAMEWASFPVGMTMPLTMVEFMILLADVVWFARRLWMEIAETVGGMLPHKDWRSILVPLMVVLAAMLLSAMTAHPARAPLARSAMTFAAPHLEAPYCLRRCPPTFEPRHPIRALAGVFCPASPPNSDRRAQA